MLKHVLTILDLLDSPGASGPQVAEALRGLAPAEASIEVEEATSERGATDFVRIHLPGTSGRTAGGVARTLGIVGRLGGVGARPERIGLVSDADGAASALAAAAKLLEMASRGDRLPGDVEISTHVDPDAPTQPHDPVPFMDSAVDITTMNRMEVSESMEAVLSIDTTKGNHVLNHRGISLSPTVRSGYILRPAPDLISLVETVTGEPARILPLAQQDITPYGNGLHHINSILQPTVATDAPVVGLALTTVTAVAGSATGASHEIDIAAAARFAVELAKGYGRGDIEVHDEDEYQRMVSLYGDNRHFQTLGTRRG